MVKKIKFARPGTSAGLTGAGGLIRRVFPLSLLALLIAMLSRNWSWLVALIPKYKITRTR